MSEARINRISNELGTGGPVISGITTFSNVNYFVPPRGTTAERPSNCPIGSIRFNTDSAHLEYFDGLQWLEMEAFNNELGVNGALGNRGVFGGGTAPSPASTTNTIDYVTISTLGNAVDFGDLPTARRGNAAFSSATRGVFAGGYNPITNEMRFITFSSTGDAQTFGNLSSNRGIMPGLSSSTRGIVAGGFAPGNTNIIEYVTIVSTGNTQDFGDLLVAKRASSSCSSSTRGLIAGGVESAVVNTIEYITIATIGNAVDFGDLLSAGRFDTNGCSNATRGIFAGGHQGTATNTIEFVIIASTGNAQDFGDLTQTRFQSSSISSSTRGVFGGGENGVSPAPTIYNIIDYITIASIGNAIDFGDLSIGRSFLNSCSNGHGGL